MRVLVCGDRRWDAPGMVYATLDQLLASFGPHMEVISGMARGADSHAARWAERNNVKLHPYPADWNRYGKRAGPIRNSRMLSEGQPDLVVAFHDSIESSKGTAHMVKIAQAAGVEVLLVKHPVENDRADVAGRRPNPDPSARRFA